MLVYQNQNVYFFYWKYGIIYLINLLSALQYPCFDWSVHSVSLHPPTHLPLTLYIFTQWSCCWYLLQCMKYKEATKSGFQCLMKACEDPEKATSLAIQILELKPQSYISRWTLTNTSSCNSFLHEGTSIEIHFSFCCYLRAWNCALTRRGLCLQLIILSKQGQNQQLSVFHILTVSWNYFRWINWSFGKVKIILRIYMLRSVCNMKFVFFELNFFIPFSTTWGPFYKGV